MEAKRFLNDSDHERIAKMESGHFWYTARYERLLRIVTRLVRERADMFDAIDLGGGVGGWINFLETRLGNRFKRLVLSDASRKALEISEVIYPDIRSRMALDINELRAKEEWDIVFMLDVLEYFWNDDEVLRRVADMVRNDGIIILAVPAYEFLRSTNDTLNGNLRRYSPKALKELASECSLEIVYYEHFMGLLSPFVLGRKVWRQRYNGDEDKRNKLLNKSHKQPIRIVNGFLKVIMRIESLLVDAVGIPFGASLFVVLRRCRTNEETL